MKIAVVGEMNPTQQLFIDKMISDGHDILYIGKNSLYGGIALGVYIIDEFSEHTDTNWQARPVKEVKKPYYRIQERY